MRKFCVIVGAVLLAATSTIPAGAASLYLGGKSEQAQTFSFTPVSHQDHWRRDCHRHPVRHFIPGYGRVLHDHDGRRCRVDVMRRADRRDRGDCIRIGDVKICV